MKKIIITDELKKVLEEVNNSVSRIILSGEIPDNYLIEEDKLVNYLDISHSNKGHLSYLNKDRIDKIELTDEKDYWRPGMRYHARPGSVLKKLFNSTLHGQFEDFSVKFLSIVDKPEFHFDLVKGDDIAKYYNYRNYRERTGNLGGSCMANVSAEIFDFYVNNGKSINMLVMLDQHDKVMGRSIIWNGSDFRVMDRIYVNNDLHINYFIDWAKKNNVFYKEYNNYRTPLNIMTPEGERVIKRFCIDLEDTVFSKYPYLDSFKWLDRKEKKIYNYIPKDAILNMGDGSDGKIKPGIRVLSDTSGNSLRGDTYTIDEMTHELYGRGDVTHLAYLNLSVYGGNTVFSKVLGLYIYRDHAVLNDEIGDYIFNDEYKHLNNEKLISEAKKNIKVKSNIRHRYDGDDDWTSDRWWETTRTPLYRNNEPVREVTSNETNERS